MTVHSIDLELNALSPNYWRRGLKAVLESLVAGTLKLPIEAILPLPEAGRAHELLESRKVSGKLLLEVP